MDAAVTAGQPAPDAAPEREAVGAAMRAHQRAVDALDEAAAGALGINRTDLRCLDVLLAAGEMTPSRLSAALGLTTGSVTAMLDRLERLGYLTRARDARDRRRTTVKPTPAAVEKAGALYGPLAADGARLLSPYTADELRLITTFLEESRELQEHHTTRIRSSTR